MQILKRLFVGLCLAAILMKSGFAQNALTWQQVRDKFRAANPRLGAGQIGVEEFRAEEITANLRPNPNASLLTDQLYPFTRTLFQDRRALPRQYRLPSLRKRASGGNAQLSA